jgi:hypothetical protein
LIGTNANSQNQTEDELASDFAYENGLLFNEVNPNHNVLRNVELVMKTIRTRVGRLVSEIGMNLPRILNNL